VFNWKSRVLAPGVIIGGFLLLMATSAYQEWAPTIEVQTSPVIVKSGEGALPGAVSVQSAGWIEADPYKSYVTALTDGIVREVLVLEGEPVKQGQVVARLVDEDAQLALRRAEDRLKETEAVLAAETAETTAALAEWENPIERRRSVTVAEAQLGENKAVIEQVAAEITVEESNLEHARSQYDRAVGLHASGAMPEQEFVRLRSLFNAQIAKVNALKSRLTSAGEVQARFAADLKAAQEHMALRTEERRKLDRARAMHTQAEASRDQARTALAEAKLRLDRMEVRSPVDGVVMTRMTEPGSKLVITSDNPTSAKVLSLYDPSRLQARVDVPLADSGKISVGQEVQATAEALPDRVIAGVVTRVLHEANIQKNTLEVKVALKDPDPKLRPEMLVRVKFLARQEVTRGEAVQRILAPESSVKVSGGQGVAWVVRDFDGVKGIAESRSVKLGPGKANGWVDVLEGLLPGDLVITRSASDLKNGSRLKVTGL
jgi:RND family efflux transporter MFP subunit